MQYTYALTFGRVVSFVCSCQPKSLRRRIQPSCSAAMQDFELFRLFNFSSRQTHMFCWHRGFFWLKISEFLWSQLSLKRATLLHHRNVSGRDTYFCSWWSLTDGRWLEASLSQTKSTLCHNDTNLITTKLQTESPAATKDKKMSQFYKFGSRASFRFQLQFHTKS